MSIVDVWIINGRVPSPWTPPDSRPLPPTSQPSSPRPGHRQGGAHTRLVTLFTYIHTLLLPVRYSCWQSDASPVASGRTQ